MVLKSGFVSVLSAFKSECHVAMGQNPVPPVNIPILTKIGSRMGGAPTPKRDPIGVDPQPCLSPCPC